MGITDFGCVTCPMLEANAEPVFHEDKPKPSNKLGRAWDLPKPSSGRCSILSLPEKWKAEIASSGLKKKNREGDQDDAGLLSNQCDAPSPW